MGILNDHIFYIKSGGKESRLAFILNLVNLLVEIYNRLLISKVYCRPHSESLSSWLQFLQLWGSYPSLPQSHRWLSIRLMAL